MKKYIGIALVVCMLVTILSMPVTAGAVPVRYEAEDAYLSGNIPLEVKSDKTDVSGSYVGMIWDPSQSIEFRVNIPVGEAGKYLLTAQCGSQWYWMQIVAVVNNQNIELGYTGGDTGGEINPFAWYPLTGIEVELQEGENTIVFPYAENYNKNMYLDYIELEKVVIPVGQTSLKIEGEAVDSMGSVDVAGASGDKTSAMLWGGAGRNLTFLVNGMEPGDYTLTVVGASIWAKPVRILLNDEPIKTTEWWGDGGGAQPPAIGSFKTIKLDVTLKESNTIVIANDGTQEGGNTYNENAYIDYIELTKKGAPQEPGLPMTIRSADALRHAQLGLMTDLNGNQTPCNFWGDGQFVKFDGIVAPEDGDYLLTVSYGSINAEKDALVYVNDTTALDANTAVTVADLNGERVSLDKWEMTGMHTELSSSAAYYLQKYVVITLREGENSLLFVKNGSENDNLFLESITISELPGAMVCGNVVVAEPIPEGGNTTHAVEQVEADTMYHTVTSIYNGTEESQNVLLIAAAYDATGKTLLNIGVGSTALDAGAAGTVRVFDWTTPEVFDHAKFFIWDGTILSPLTVQPVEMAAAQ